MFRFISLGGYKPDKESVAKAKGKHGKSFANELFGAVNDFLYEFGIIKERPQKDGFNKEKHDKTKI